MSIATNSIFNKPEYDVISGIIRSGASVLDLGCGDGELLAGLKKKNNIIHSQGIELDEQAIYKCVSRGLSVFHGDIDTGLSEYDSNSFDYVILNQSFQQVKQPDKVLSEALRVGREVIVGFPNFAHYLSRYQLAFRGVSPITRSLPYEWYNSPNTHFLSIADFRQFCQKRNIYIEKEIFLGNKGLVKLFPNLRALVGIFLIKRNP
jgi:methionine biosynthesis protein MetW